MFKVWETTISEQLKETRTMITSANSNSIDSNKQEVHNCRHKILGCNNSSKEHQLRSSNRIKCNTNSQECRCSNSNSCNSNNICNNNTLTFSSPDHNKSTSKCIELGGIVYTKSQGKQDRKHRMKISKIFTWKCAFTKRVWKR